MSTRPIQWIELHGQAHIIKNDRYLDRALCGIDLAESTLIFKGDELEGCADCITKYAAQNTEKRPEWVGGDDDWPDFNADDFLK